ncbi:MULTISPECIES: hypothetical protein [Chryseobacterium]|uniref:ParB/Sulfiredoxin domain-containing protein n=1 Tax=Chryseobacterium camelliae TaxID=1265445 RepID=A0ABU0TF77_9FLAO|nr:MULTISPECIES: hypothetical protein [Chryseobacterium]MDT3406489.1 hypothetical protein [Pseudacidovorax intermedius]MDQ1095713.1 hypothetical protein [Chryseobacterium camelliae]MDQ1099649.1 hypothetical protein [Chryseobacterium sp. SORGH_AS_1048]MDR6086998.1 hypothetical protein [Chryseobacterium sp. SORGH_AS_0909]MDR6131370.1 hypothetical protein [Chryseobacterium sp. SORGH_AS_1175]
MDIKEKSIRYNDLWLKEPEEHDFPAALDYLELLFEPETAAGLVTQLKQAKTIRKKAKDLFRASRLPLLPRDNIHVKENLKKVKNKKKLSPILLVRGKERLIIADGYHRLCCSYYLTEDLEVPCRLV